MKNRSKVEHDYAEVYSQWFSFTCLTWTTPTRIDFSFNQFTKKSANMSPLERNVLRVVVCFLFPLPMRWLDSQINNTAHATK